MFNNRLPYFIIAFLFLMQMSSKAQMCLDAYMIEERYPMQNSQLADFMDNSFNDKYYEFGMSLIEKNSMPAIYPSTYLLREDEAWVYRVWQVIDSKDSSNLIFGQGPLSLYNQTTRQRERDTTMSLFNILYDKLSGYTSDYRTCPLGAYENDLFNGGIDSSLLMNRLEQFWKYADKIKIKEDWYYDKTTGEFKEAIIGIAPVATLPDGQSQDICWIYYPELRWTLRDISFSERDDHFVWSDIFSRRLFDGEVIRSRNPTHYTFPRGTNPDASALETRIDHRALFQLKMIEKALQFHVSERPEKDKIVYTLRDGSQASGKMDQGFMNGTWSVTNPSGSILVTVEYRNNIPHGAYKSYWPDGSPQEDGQFEFGLREGTWNAWYENGQKMSSRNFYKGWYNGKQEVWHKNGTRKMTYFFEDHILHGQFDRWYNDETLLESGWFEKGIRKGEWEFNLKVPEEHLAIIKANPRDNEFWGFDIHCVDDGLLSFKMLYTHEQNDRYFMNLKISSELVGDMR